MIYIQLFHGRNDPDADMAEAGKDNGGWGFDGPQFACESIHGTYCSHFRMWRARLGDGVIADDEVFLYWYDDMIYYDGKYYGDFSISDQQVDGHSVTPYEGEKSDSSLDMRRQMKERHDARLKDHYGKNEVAGG